MKESAFGISDVALERVRAVLARYPEVDCAIVYGSRAKGNFKPGSDIDLTLKGARLTNTHLLTIMREMDDLLLPYRIDLSLFQAIENPDLVTHIERIGKPLFVREC